MTDAFGSVRTPWTNDDSSSSTSLSRSKSCCKKVRVIRADQDHRIFVLQTAIAWITRALRSRPRPSDRSVGEVIRYDESVKTAASALMPV